MLLGAKITIHTDHLNILTLGDSSQRRLRWISYVDEYGPTIEHIEGAKNVIADHFSRMPLVSDEPTSPAVGKKSATLDDNREIADDSDPLDNHHIWIDDIRDIIECFACLHEDDCYLNLPSDLQADNPLDMETIKEEQEKDEILKKRVQKYSDRYTTKRISNVDDIICHIKPGDDKSNWKIALPQSLLLPTIKWFHQVTGHPGSKRLMMQIGARYYHSELRHKIDKFHCEHCQRNKLDGKGYGLLPEREIRTMPFNECAVDLVGPWVVQVNGKPYEFFALTAIDTVTNLVELVRIDDKTSEHVARKFAQLWLARYPWPERCVHDNGGEFVGPAFSMLMQRCGIKDVNTTAKNPTANSICERMHQTVGNVLRTLLHGEPPKNISKAREFIDEALSIAMHAMRSGVHSTLGSSPGNLVFNRDMFLNIPLIADWEAITKKREHLVNENLMRENRRRRQYDYQPNQLVLKKNHNPRKLGERTSGPYTISKVHTNGTVTLQISEDLSERINIRRVIPYKS
jgi:transposase InsO family protein